MHLHLLSIEEPIHDPERQTASDDGTGLAADAGSDIHRLLCRVGMLVSLVYFQMREQAPAQPALWQHALDCVLDDALWYPLRMRRGR